VAPPQGPGEEGFEERATELAALFGADSVLFVRILGWSYDIKRLDQPLKNAVDWEGTYTVGIEYHLTDDRGQTLWQSKQQIALEKGGGMIWTQICNFLTKPLDPEVGLAREANRNVIEGQRHREGRRMYYPIYPMLVGPYHPRYERDRTRRRGTTSP
jgi:hypothetical protein